MRKYSNASLGMPLDDVSQGEASCPRRAKLRAGDGVLLLEDGRSFRGRRFGARTTTVGELVFNTSMTGYQEVLTDPSYAEQVVLMTAPHIGNYGINSHDNESERVHVAGFIARSFTDRPSSWRSEMALEPFLLLHGIPALDRLDTRAMVRHLRHRGAMKCAISTDGTPLAELQQRLAAWPGMVGRALATSVTCTEAKVLFDPPDPKLRLAVVDGGVKNNILHLLGEAGCFVRVHPLHHTAEDWMRDVDAVLVSNGPGDPASYPHVVAELRKVVGHRPTLGICLGHQLLAHALGGKTYKLKFGHRGANQPVRDRLSGQIEITSQNHGFAVDADSLIHAGATLTHIHLNDRSVSGFMHREKRVMAVQYHPEASPGPHDSRSVLVKRFIQFAKGAYA